MTAAIGIVALLALLTAAIMAGWRLASTNRMLNGLIADNGRAVDVNDVADMAGDPDELQT